MQKTKFQIKGMNCQSCATLIEQKIKELNGIFETKVNLESKKVVVIFDENKIKESEIKKAVESVGDYKVEELNETKQEIKENKSPNSNSFNLSIPISIIIAGLIIAGAIMMSNRSYQSIKENIAKNQPTPVLPENNSLPQQNQPTLPLLAQFEITKDDHVRGDFNAPITLVEFSDFECPFCVRHYPTMNKILDDYKGKVRLVYKHFPLGFHPNAQKAAEASECADEQGKFWEYHDKLFENQATGYSLEKFKQWAKDLGLNSQKFNDCLDSGKYTSKVQKDYQDGLQKGVQGTPATFVNGQLVSGALPYDNFKQIINSVLKE